MNKINLSLTIIALGLMGLLSCNESKKDTLKIVSTEAVEPIVSIDTAKMEYDLELTNYKTQTTEKIMANDKKLQDFKNDITNKKRLSDKAYQSKIAALEGKNKDLKKRINEYLATDRMGWYDFREKCEYDMQCLDKDLYNICNPIMAK